MKDFIKLIILAGIECVALVMAIVGAASLPYVGSDGMKLACLLKPTCAYAHAVNTAFSFNIITAVFCFLCGVAFVLCIFFKKLISKVKHVAKGLNGLCSTMELISIIITPVLYEKAYKLDFFERSSDDANAYWACTFICMIVNIVAGVFIVGLSL